MSQLLIVEAPHFVAGAEFEFGWCTRAAPIIKWMVGKRYSDIQFKAPDNYRFRWYCNIPSEEHITYQPTIDDLFNDGIQEEDKE